MLLTELATISNWKKKKIKSIELDGEFKIYNLFFHFRFIYLYINLFCIINNNNNNNSIVKKKERIHNFLVLIKYF